MMISQLEPFVRRFYMQKMPDIFQASNKKEFLAEKYRDKDIFKESTRFFEKYIGSVKENYESYHLFLLIAFGFGKNQFLFYSLSDRINIFEYDNLFSIQMGIDAGRDDFLQDDDEVELSGFTYANFDAQIIYDDEFKKLFFQGIGTFIYDDILKKITRTALTKVRANKTLRSPLERSEMKDEIIDHILHNENVNNIAQSIINLEGFEQYSTQKDFIIRDDYGKSIKFVPSNNYVASSIELDNLVFDINQFESYNTRSIKNPFSLYLKERIDNDLHDVVIKETNRFSANWKNLKVIS